MSLGQHTTTSQPADTLANQQMTQSGAVVRPRQSRKDRPCDYCRRLKHYCEIRIRGEPCSNCQKAKKACTFNNAARTRKRNGSIQTNDQYGDWSAITNAQAIPQAATIPTLASPPQDTLSALLRSSGSRDPSSSLDDDNDDVVYSSLDGEVNDIEESHYLGSGALLHLLLGQPPRLASASADIHSSPGTSTLPSSSGGSDLVYRQVAGPSQPVFFLKNPSRVYGLSNAAFEAQKAWQDVTSILAEEHPEMPARLIQLFYKRTLPALPMLNRVRLETSSKESPTSPAFPHTVLVGILVHSAVYVPSLKHRWKNLWSKVLNLLDNEYRQSRLQTLQLALLDIYGRPVVNPGGNHLAITRALGVAQLLGLHRNSDKWQLPRWERAIRKRIWWTLYIADKWFALQYGRPSNIPTEVNVPLPTLQDDDWGGTHNDKDSSCITFVAMCRLTTILDRLLPLLADHNRESNSSEHERQAVLFMAAKRLEDDFTDLPIGNLPGSHSFKLSLLGVTALICRLALDRMEHGVLVPMRGMTDHALVVFEQIVKFLEDLTVEGYAAYWAPWSSFQLTQGVSLLLRAVREADKQIMTMTTSNTRQKALGLLDRYVTAIFRAIDGSWQIAEESLGFLRIQISASNDIPGLEGIKSRLAPPPAFGFPSTSVVPPAEVSLLDNVQNFGDFGLGALEGDFAAIFDAGLQSEWAFQFASPSQAPM